MTNLPARTDFRCKVCTHPKRKEIDRLLASGAMSPTEIEDLFADSTEPVPRRSVARHAKRHLDYENQAIRNIVERRAEEQGINVDTTTGRILTHRAYLDLIIQKGFTDLVENQPNVYPKDVYKAIELSEQMEKDALPFSIDQIQRQYAALIQAIKEVVPVDLIGNIIDRAKEINESYINATSVPDHESGNREGDLALGAGEPLPPSGEER